MHKTIIISVAAVVCTYLFSCSGGNKFYSDTEVNTLRDSAFYNYYEKPHFKISFKYYNLLLKTKSYSLNDVFYAAHAAALSGNYKRSVELMKMMLKNYKDQNAAKFVSHIVDTSWSYHNELMKVVNENGFEEINDAIEMQKPESSYQQLAIFLNDMRKKDQNVRFNYRKNPTEKNQQIIDKLDSMDQITVDSILNLYGFISYKKVGYTAAKSLSILYLHLDSMSYMTNFHYVKKAHKDRSIVLYDNAQLLDRYLIRSNRKQEYGTYYHYDSLKRDYVFYPIRNFKNLEKRRRKMNLDSLAKFARINDITYPPK